MANASIDTAQFNGIDGWRIRTPTARAFISRHGGQLVSWHPNDHGEVLWCSSTTRMPPGAIRGGVPICWPYFGRDGQSPDAPQHGHARVSEWRLIDAREEDDDLIVDLALPDDPRTRLRARQRIRIGAHLEQTLATFNSGEQPITFTSALHSYFAVGDVHAVRVEGLGGCMYDDKLRGGRHEQRGAWRLDEAPDPGHCDRIYIDAGPRVEVIDPAGARRICIDTLGSRSVVLWNPGERGAAEIADLSPGGWRGFLCVEAANAGDDRVLVAPGATHRLGQRISVSALDAAID